MAFALSVSNLIEAMRKPGCPVCRMSRQAAERALESFLWENVNEPDVRQGILDSYGFCPAHTRVMVARELVTSSLPLGTNIIYEHLGRVVANELKSQRTGGVQGAANRLSRLIRDLLHSVGLPAQMGQPLAPRGECPACSAGSTGGLNSLHVLCDELQRQAGQDESEMRSAYRASTGLCLTHLRAAIGLHSKKFPLALQFLIDDAVERLENQSRQMKEFIRKANWTYQDERVSEAEDTAWRKTLGFFTGLPGESFIYKVDE